jgi:2-deoxy-D-gluconate 3-dehydrogenase
LAVAEKRSFETEKKEERMSYIKKSFDLSGKVAVVIGGTSGIGRGIALTLADYGADVVPASRTFAKSEAVAAEIEGIGRKSLAAAADANKQEDLEKLRDDVLDKFGKVDILVNSQGVQVVGLIKDFTYEDWRTVISTNLDSVFMATNIFMQPMIQQRSGKIISIASMASFLGLMAAGAYTASKGGVMQFTKACALELAEYNIQVNAIAPGWFKTELTAPIYRDTPDRYEEIRARIPAGKWGDTEDLGACAVYLASNAGDYVTGVTIPVDGGYVYNGG